MALTKEKKITLTEGFKKHKTDTGSTSVQIAILTGRINELTSHLKDHKKDHHSRRGLLKLVGQRRRLLEYLKRTEPQKYQHVIKELKIRK